MTGFVAYYKQYLKRTLTEGAMAVAVLAIGAACLFVPPAAVAYVLNHSIVQLQSAAAAMGTFAGLLLVWFVFVIAPVCNYLGLDGDAA